MSQHEWREVRSDSQFAALFVGATIAATTTALPDGIPWVEADLFWKLTSGVWLAMHVSEGSGCPTCGYGGGDKTYYTLAAVRPPEPEPGP